VAGDRAEKTLGLVSLATAETPPLAAIHNKRFVPLLIAFAFFLQALDTTILNTAVPVVSKALDVAPLEMRSVLATYTLSLALFIPISGWMADRFGTRPVLTCAIGVFTLSSLLCGLCNNIHLLVACRALQGAGGAMMVPVGRLTLVRTFPKSELVRAMSFVTVPAMIGPMLGPLAGGLIVAYLNWRFVFFINVPIGIIGLILTFLYLPDFRQRTTKLPDIVGMILFGAGIALFSYVLEVFGDHSLGALEIAGLTLLALALLAGYAVHGEQMRHPLLNLKLFWLRTFRAAVGGGLVTRLGISGIPFLLPLLYQVGLGFSPVESGLLIIPQALAALCAKLVVSSLLHRLGYRTLLIVNTALVGVFIAAFGTIGTQTPLWLIVAVSAGFGMFQSTQMTCMNTLVYADVSAREASSASSLASTVQQLSISFAVAAAGLITALFIPPSLRAHAPAFIAGIHEAFFTIGAYTIVTSAVFWNLHAEDGLSVSHQAKES
jgi:EmrB/QacA subfamily drug resistance transporter